MDRLARGGRAARRDRQPHGPVGASLTRYPRSRPLDEPQRPRKGGPRRGGAVRPQPEGVAGRACCRATAAIWSASGGQSQPGGPAQVPSAATRRPHPTGALPHPARSALAAAAAAAGDRRRSPPAAREGRGLVSLSQPESAGRPARRSAGAVRSHTPPAPSWRPTSPGEALSCSRGRRRFSPLPGKAAVWSALASQSRPGGPIDVGQCDLDVGQCKLASARPRAARVATLPRRSRSTVAVPAAAGQHPEY